MENGFVIVIFICVYCSILMFYNENAMSIQRHVNKDLCFCFTIYELIIMCSGHDLLDC